MSELTATEADLEDAVCLDTAAIIQTLLRFPAARRWEELATVMDDLPDLLAHAEAEMRHELVAKVRADL